MRQVVSVTAMQDCVRRWERRGVRIGLVPTMGYLHDGHLSLVKYARQAVGRQGVVVLSIYVNPTQFAPNEDFSRYPRDLDRDRRMCRQAGVDVVFAPSDGQMYPSERSGPFSSFVIEEQLAKGLEGVSRPSHFRGVATVVAKLFNIVRPGVAVFGAKDYQQAAVIKRIIRDLNFPIRLVVAPIFREPDGLAMSSRNKYLEGDLRTQALVLWRALEMAREAVRRSKRPIPASRLQAQLRRFIQRAPAARVDYVEFFESATLRPVRRVVRGTHLALAVFIGTTRLIDNASLV